MVLIGKYFNIKGKNITPKFGKICKRIIPCIVEGKGNDNYYPVKICVNFQNLLKDAIYQIDYLIIKEVPENVFQNILKNFEDFKSDSENNSSECS